MNESPDLLPIEWSFTEGQAWALCLASAFSGLLSLGGSVRILYEILWHRTEKRRLFERFVLAMTISDMLATLSVSIGGFGVPRTTQMPAAFGNTATCKVAAFFFHAYLAVGCTCMNLILYFYFTLAKKWSDQYIAQKWELSLHTVAFLLPLGVAISAILSHDRKLAIMGHLCTADFVLPACTSDDDGPTCQQNEETSFPVWLCLILVMSFTSLVTIFTTVQLMRQVKVSSLTRVHATVSGAAAQRQEKVARQAFLYMLSYLNTVIWLVVLIVITWCCPVDQIHKPFPYMLVFLVHLLLPLRGFFNFFTYYPERYFPCFGCSKSNTTIQEGDRKSVV